MRPMSMSLSLALLLVACGTTFGDARDSFQDGQYARAKQELLSIGGDYTRWDAPRQARYAVYLGLTHAELGDTREAKRWLLCAKGIEESHRGTLSIDDWQRLELGLAALEPPVSP